MNTVMDVLFHPLLRDSSMTVRRFIHTQRLGAYCTPATGSLGHGVCEEQGQAQGRVNSVALWAAGPRRETWE